MNTQGYTMTCSQMFLAALFIITKCPSTGCIGKEVVEYGYNVMLSAFKKNRLLIHTTWIHLKIALLSEVKEAKFKTFNTMWFHPHESLEKAKLQWQEAKQWFSIGGSQVTILTTNGHKGTFWSIKNNLYTDLDGVYTRAYFLQILLGCTWALVNFIACSLYFNEVHFT